MLMKMKMIIVKKEGEAWEDGNESEGIERVH